VSGDGEPRGSARLWFALALAAALIAAVVILVTAGGDEEAAVASAPSTCLKDWNRDPVAREAGRHNHSFHRYEEAQVGYLDPTDAAAAVATDPAAGLCAAVFPSGELDPEPEYAGFVLEGGRWVSLSDVLDPTRVGALQATALEASNATLTEDGELEAR
jgi:hypothetical protein